MRAETYWRAALARSAQAQASGALVPLSTERLDLPELAPFVLRRLVSRTPIHLRADGPRPNPFLPWEAELEVASLGDDHVLLLNKFPVQPAHLLVITRRWQPQAGWLGLADWQAVTRLSSDCGGLWFFNSCAAAGASQPHRHLQLLPRASGEPSCPLAPLLRQQLQARESSRHGPLPADQGFEPWPWAYALSRRCDPCDPLELERLYLRHAELLELGKPGQEPQPRHPYNLLFDDEWLLTVRRRQEHCAGFSLNALAFAGYLLATEGSQTDWLRQRGPWALLQAVAWPRPAAPHRAP